MIFICTVYQRCIYIDYWMMPIYSVAMSGSVEAQLTQGPVIVILMLSATLAVMLLDSSHIGMS